ncbi:MAG TPA: rhodanese-like domain-containing protein [Gammaproteobacteria bacterium]|nr:rhodanese-like domain-containing protein [Gammaproteobacteria bacterium]
MRHWTPKELKHSLEASEGPLMVDVREPWEHEICRIDGARLIPMGQIPALAGRLDPDQTIVVVCHHGVRSYQVAYYLERLGFRDVINLTGGIDAWAREVDRDMAVY